METFHSSFHSPLSVCVFQRKDSVVWGLQQTLVGDDTSSHYCFMSGLPQPIIYSERTIRVCVCLYYYPRGYRKYQKIIKEGRLTGEFPPSPPLPLPPLPLLGCDDPHDKILQFTIEYYSVYCRIIICSILYNTILHTVVSLNHM